MANQGHLDMIKKGVAQWNAWRKANPSVVPNLSSADLTDIDLSRAQLHDADLSLAQLDGADLSWAHLHRADLNRAHLHGADLTEANLTAANLTEADLTWAHLRGVHLGGANLTRANLNRAHLSGAHLYKANLSEANLSDANLSQADLNWADLSRACLTEADLSEANLHGANLSRAYLYGVDFSDANLSNANLHRAILNLADLHGADLNWAHLQDTNFCEATIGLTTLGATELDSAQGLNTVRHIGPSIIGIDTLYKSDGKIHEAFLRGCGVPDSLIEYLPSLIGAMQPLQFYSCFISYSTKDEDFARRLHQRMRAEHLRVWFAPEDIQGGKKLHEQVERAIQLYDRLLLVLSEDSIHSEWVTSEIYNARQVEIREQRRKLYPIRLISMETLKAWKCFDLDAGKDLAREVREYFIPDFSNWKDHEAFEAAFAGLLRDLRATEAP
jgi:uncharacterized protein YjbI with pentapeptide repeats